VTPVRRQWSHRFLDTFGAADDLERPPQLKPQRRRRAFS